MRVRSRAFRRFGAGSLAAVILFVSFLASGCARLDVTAVQSGLKENPYYQLGDTSWDHGGIEEYYYNQLPGRLNEIYRELYERIRSYEDSALVYALVSTEDFWTAYYAVLADHPELFWVGADVEVEETALTGKAVRYRLSVTVPKEERDEMRVRLEEAADACISQIPEEVSAYQRIKYVYEYLINTVEYHEESEANQNIQSALLSRVSVCAGYARAFQYILHRMGMFCTYVTGKTDSGGDHAWNIVRIGDAYYNVDVTWGDPVFAGGGSSRQSMNYNYLCCTDADLARTHKSEASVVLPACTDDSFNYYRLNGMYYDHFDYQRVYDALMGSVRADQSRVMLKFADDEGYTEAKRQLFDENMINDAAQYLMKTYGAAHWDYTYQTDDAFRLITIYWKE